MTSLPVRTVYQTIGKQVQALPNAIVHIVNSVYLRSKSMTNDIDSLKHYVDYGIAKAAADRNYTSVDYSLQIQVCLNYAFIQNNRFHR